ncbi:membrane-spanning 4-domains subfamily A member 13 [Elephas maximus indicus]|uniref:membrane-spanning 4-domains subfamily A member 13 n=1 Tax=Elephas maximus indicus TaxID=99487 RepID=UPI0005403974|nr:membrane-spanning 4-domains subfamily A member 13 [Elephas maximus indicus]
MIGTFHVFMWYFVMFLYMGQNHGVFGTYEPLTYKTGCALWGVFFILSGIFIIKTERHASHCLVACALSMNILSIIAAIIALILTIIELSQFHSVSYRNYGQAKLGREVSRVLLVSYHLEISIAFVYSLFTCTDLVYYLLGIVIGSKDVKNKTDNDPTFMKLVFQWGRQTVNKEIQKCHEMEKCYEEV